MYQPPVARHGSAPTPRPPRRPTDDRTIVAHVFATMRRAAIVKRRFGTDSCAYKIEEV
jgi:hypothetical protein